MSKGKAGIDKPTQSAAQKQPQPAAAARRSSAVSHPNLRINLTTINLMCALGIVAHTSRQITEVSSQVSLHSDYYNTNIKVWQRAEEKHITNYYLVAPTQG